MALDTYAHLQTSIQDWLARNGDSTISGVAPDLILLFEAEARDRLRTRFNEINTTLTTVSGTQTVSLPADCWQIRELTITSTSPIRELVYMSPETLDDTWSDGTDAQPYNYTQEGTTLRLGPIPDAAYTLTLRYMQGLPALSNSNTTNWLLTNYPDVYLAGSLAWAELYIGNDERLMPFVQAKEAGFQRLRMADIAAKFGGGPLQIKTDTLNP